MLESTGTSSLLKRKVSIPLQPPSKAPRADHGEVLHFFGTDKKSRQFNWYVLDVRRGIVHDRLKMPHDFPCSSSAVACPDRLYVLGGNDGSVWSDEEEDSIPALKSVFCFDLENPKAGWTKAPPMLFGRLNPSSIAFNGKIYVFGGSLTHFAEVFDISRDTWYELEPPFAEFGISKPVLLDSSRSRILVHFSLKKSLYAYNVANKSWECLNDNYGEWYRDSVIVDGVIYSLEDIDDDYYYLHFAKDCSLGAYDVDGKRKLIINYWLLKDEVRAIHNAGLFNLGNNRLCLAGYDKNAGLIQYIKFSVHRCTNSGEICVTRDGDSKPLQSIPLKVGCSKFLSS